LPTSEPSRTQQAHPAQLKGELERFVARATRKPCRNRRSWVVGAVTAEETLTVPPRQRVDEGCAEMGTRGADRDDGSGGRLARAWRWLQSSGFMEDEALYGPPRPDLGKERFVLSVLTQAVFWRTNR